MSMKHYIYITLAIALSIVTACTEHPIVQVPQVPESSRSYIFFEPEVVDNKATKATFVEGDHLPAGSTEAPSAFGVIGYYNGKSIFDGYEKSIAEVYRKGENTSFQYDVLAWWRDRDAAASTKHNFFAFYPYSIKEVVEPNNGNPYISYTLPTSEADMEDILTAYTQTARISTVPLEFQHRLWALDVEVVNRQTGGLPEIHNVGTGLCQINRWNVQLKHLLFLNYQVTMDVKSRLSHTRQAAFVIQTGWYSGEFSASIRT